jgi:hypothetical protein
MDKAFTCQKRGKVLGVKFDSTDLTWSLSDKKIQNALGSVKMAVTNDDISLKDCQRLVGRLNDVGQLCPFMKINSVAYIYLHLLKGFNRRLLL